ncbi:MAG: hypothetical protein FWC20_00555 [Oscillospiraceae bacterium]|nr:hypothetical protein [Oscillospiraceae bacterium]MCL2277883.1 hypothetical protein [Oscillospiraceae bacterium]
MYFIFGDYQHQAIFFGALCILLWIVYYFVVKRPAKKKMMRDISESTVAVLESICNGTPSLMGEGPSLNNDDGIYPESIIKSSTNSLESIQVLSRQIKEIKGNGGCSSKQILRPERI